MKDFIFQNPTKVVFGKGKISKLGSEVKKVANKVLIVYGRGSIKDNGVYDMVTNSLKSSNVDWVELPGVKPNPILSKVYDGIELARKEGIDAVVAIGGGSVIDTSKTIAAGYHYKGDIWDAFTGKYKVEKSLAIFVVLTISATGSEMNGGAVITNEKTRQKYSFWATTSYPKLSVLDPSAQFSLPKIQTANGAADAIAHVLELYFDNTPNTLILDEISEGIIRTVMNSTEILLRNPNDYDARANLIWSATLALNGINGTGRSGGDWSSHAIEHSLSALYDIAHGSGLSIIFPAWMEYVRHEDVEKFARFSRKIFEIGDVDDEKAALEGIKRLKKWYKDIGLPVTLHDANIPFDGIERVVENAAMRTPFGRLKRLEPNDVRKILELCA